MNPIRTLLAAIGVLIFRPSLWPTAVVQARRLVPDGWWRRPPFLPVPDTDLLAFRATTQYGDPQHPVVPDDLISWLEWCRAEARR